MCYEEKKKKVFHRCGNRTVDRLRNIDFSVFF
mgnify:CR=1 FL=1